MFTKHFIYSGFVAISLLSLLSYSCRKEDLITVSGLLTDPNQGKPVAGVKVELWTQQIDAGIFSANYVLASSDSTGSDGKFLFNLENKNYTGIRQKFSKAGYFGWDADVNMDKLNADNGFYAEYQLLPQARLQIHVKNVSPVNSSDYFEFRIMNGYTVCEECCKGEKYQFAGMEIDQTIECLTAGHQDIYIQWSKRKDDEQIFKTESYFVKAFEITGIWLNY